MDSAAKVVLYNASGRPAQSLCQRLAERGLRAECVELDAATARETRLTPDVAILVLGEHPDLTAARHALDVLRHLVETQVATLVWGSPQRLRWAGGPLVEWLDPNASLDEIIGHLGALTRYAPLVRRIESELQRMHRFGEQLNRYFNELDQEMRLASRLQHDFLPRYLSELPGLRFGVLYRPASWVSGDLYDARAIDDRHIGLFVADAMGHGVAAGLLTMALRQTLLNTLTDGTPGDALRPATVLTQLDLGLQRLKLPNCNFVTAAYATYQPESRELIVARGGHPHPLHIRRDVSIEPIMAGGGLLGLPDVPGEFEEVRRKLEPGDKVLFFTDGLEHVFFAAAGPTQTPEYAPALRDWAGLPVQDFVDALATHLDSSPGSLHPADDMTLLAVEAL